MSDYGETTLEATSNLEESSPNYHTFLDVSGGSGNGSDPEIHLMLHTADGDEFAQGWFDYNELATAIGKAVRYSE